MPRGGDRGGRKPKLNPDLKRVPSAFKLAPETRAILKAEKDRQGKSEGVLIDEAVKGQYGEDRCS